MEPIHLLQRLDDYYACWSQEKETEAQQTPSASDERSFEFPDGAKCREGRDSAATPVETTVSAASTVQQQSPKEKHEQRCRNDQRGQNRRESERKRQLQINQQSAEALGGCRGLLATGDLAATGEYAKLMCGGTDPPVAATRRSL